jgi:hypothetical protein
MVQRLARKSALRGYSSSASNSTLASCFGAAYLGVALFFLGVFIAVSLFIWKQEIKDWDNSFIAAYYLNCPDNFSANDQANHLALVFLICGEFDGGSVSCPIWLHSHQVAQTGAIC